jgi:hypothetical protein
MTNKLTWNEIFNEDSNEVVYTTGREFEAVIYKEKDSPMWSLKYTDFWTAKNIGGCPVTVKNINVFYLKTFAQSVFETYQKNTN